jgi:selenocysteine lyase/cysteine desulfurase
MSQNFDKSLETFPIKDNYVFLSHCGISPLYSGAFRKICEICEMQMRRGTDVFDTYVQILDRLRSAAARLLDVPDDDLAFVKNTSEGLGLIAGGYPFKAGDEVIGYEHEYPANYHPWAVLERRGVGFVRIPNADLGVGAEKRPAGWSLECLKNLVTPKTRMIAISHVQFTSGFAANLEQLGKFCEELKIDLVVDAAQSFGVLPLYPKRWGIAALASSGWKWLMGPVGTGILYTSEPFRSKLLPVLVGAEAMRQGTDYLNLNWDPHETAKRFEYSTSPVALAAGLACCIEELPLRYGVENIRDEIFRLQDLFLEKLDLNRYRSVRFPAENRSGILSLICPGSAEELSCRLKKKKVYCTSRGGYLRFAPHVYITDEDVARVADVLRGE